MPITPSNPPNYTNNPAGAIPVYIASGDINTGFVYVKNTPTSLTPTSTANQPVLGLTNGVALAANTRYYVEGQFVLSQIGNANNHTETVGFTSSTSLAAINVQIIRNRNDSPSTSFSSVTLSNTAALTALAYTATGNADYVNCYNFSGYVVTNAAATNLNPILVFGSNSGTSSTVLENAYFKFTPNGASGSNFVVGTWS